jgi:hypothetical protein
VSANGGLLAIPDVDPNEGSPDRNPVQILSYASITTSIGSIIMGLLLIRYIYVELVLWIAKDSSAYLDNTELMRGKAL